MAQIWQPQDVDDAPTKPEDGAVLEQKFAPDQRDRYALAYTEKLRIPAEPATANASSMKADRRRSPVTIPVRGENRSQ